MSLWKNPAPDAAQPMVNTSEILTVSSAYTNHCITCAEATARAEAAEAELRRVYYDNIHTCHAECPRLPCVQRREIEALTAELAYHGIYPK